MKTFKRYFLLILSSMFFAMTQTAIAGMLVTYEFADGGISYEIDGDKMRMNISQSSEMYYLILGDKGYQVMTPDDGEVMVMDVAQTMGMLGGLSKMAGIKVEQLDFVDTGKTESIAGYKGTLYLSTTRVKSSFSNKTTTSEVVLSDHPDVYKASKSMSKFSESVAGSLGAGFDDIQKMLDNKKFGMLRSDEMRLVSIKNKRIDKKRFKLPAEPTSLSDMLGGAGQQDYDNNDSDSDDDANSGGVLGGLFGNKASRQKNRQESRANSKADRATDKVVDKALKKIFGF